MKTNDTTTNISNEIARNSTISGILFAKQNVFHHEIKVQLVALFTRQFIFVVYVHVFRMLYFRHLFTRIFFFHSYQSGDNFDYLATTVGMCITVQWNSLYFMEVKLILFMCLLSVRCVNAKMFSKKSNITDKNGVISW